MRGPQKKQPKKWENASVHDEQPPGSFGYLPIDSEVYAIDTPLPPGLNEYAKSLIAVENLPVVHH